MASIRLNEVSLDYISKLGHLSLLKTITNFLTGHVSEANQVAKLNVNSKHRALKNINLTINDGDRVGLIGKNGAGKSTLLKVLAKVYRPNQGIATIDGEIASLFDIKLGLNEEATGYENIVSLAVMRGLTIKEAHAITREVAEFINIGDFLYQAVRTYSAGMLMKLAFAVSTAIPAGIILIDEIIGAGDMHFMEKATKRLDHMVSKSQILVLSSHSNDIIRHFCNKALVLDAGEVQYYGDVESAIRLYEDGTLDEPRSPVTRTPKVIEAETALA